MRPLHPGLPATISKTSGLIMLAAGIIHAGIYLAQFLTDVKPTWEGSLSLRKPILFGISTGLTAWSAGWLFRVLPSRRFDLAASGTLAVTLTAEVFLISMQTWRSVRSHFHSDNPFDRGVEGAMTILISVAVGILLWLTIRCFQTVNTNTDMKIAIRAGMVYLIASCIIGYLISYWGHRQIRMGLEPEMVGAAGVAKFPHGLAIHAIQLLPLTVWFQNRLGFSQPQSQQLTLGLAVVFGLFLAFSILQTILGRARFDLSIYSGALLIGTTTYGLFLSWTAIQFFRRNRKTHVA